MELFSSAILLLKKTQRKKITTPKNQDDSALYCEGFQADTECLFVCLLKLRFTHLCCFTFVCPFVCCCVEGNIKFAENVHLVLSSLE